MLRRRTNPRYRLKQRQAQPADAQSSTTLQAAAVASNFEQDGQDGTSGQSASSQSSNNFINYCDQTGLPLADGTARGATTTCSQLPIGKLPSAEKMPSIKIKSPLNGENIEGNKPLTVQYTVRNFEAGIGVNSSANYLTAPQQVNSQGVIMGHVSLDVVKLTSLDQVEVLDPAKFELFTSDFLDVNNGVGTKTVNLGLVPGAFYRLHASLRTANSAPINVPLDQHGSLEDFVYFTVPNDTSSSSRQDLSAALSESRRSSIIQDVTVDQIKRQIDPGSCALAAKNDTGPQTSLTVLPSLIAPNFAQSGLPSGGSVDGLTDSLTSSNNYINFCLNGTNTITNGQQLSTASCNTAPLGELPGTESIPSSKFMFPKHGAALTANQAFTVQLAVRNMVTGFFTNPKKNYLAAPQQTCSGTVMGHAHYVIEKLQSINQTDATDPQQYVVFKEMDSQASNTILTSDISSGLQPGVYRISSILTGANHQSIAVATPQYSAINDAVYFSVNGSPSNGTGGGSSSTDAGVDKKSRSARTIGAAVGGTLGAITFLLLFAGIIYCRRKRRRNVAPVSPATPSSHYLPSSMTSNIPSTGLTVSNFSTAYTRSQLDSAVGQRTRSNHASNFEPYPPSMQPVQYTEGSIRQRSEKTKHSSPIILSPPVASLRRVPSNASIAPSYHTNV